MDRARLILESAMDQYLGVWPTDKQAKPSDKELGSSDVLLSGALTWTLSLPLSHQQSNTVIATPYSEARVSANFWKRRTLNLSSTALTVSMPSTRNM